MYDDLLIEGTVGEQAKKAVVMVGRMNPPTAGHYQVINLMKKFARENKGVQPIVVVVAGDKSSKDLKKNPLSAEDRIKYMEASGNANGVKFISSNSAFAAFEAVRQAGLEPYAIAAGSDRGEKYKEMLDKYFTGKDGEPLKHVIMPGLDERSDPDDEGTPSEEVLARAEKGETIPLHLISGSMARLAVKLGYHKAFATILGVKQSLADIIFKKVAASLDAPDPEPEAKPAKKTKAT
jgi:cytidyltransferase-like protein